MTEPTQGCSTAADPTVNYFSAPGVAERYAVARPCGHSEVLSFLNQTLVDRLPVPRALDVGCGTGHSTHALLQYARAIVGVDASSEMLAQVTRDPRIDFRKGHAEALPCRQGEFDLVTVSSAYHWFDRDRFLTEAARVLRPGGCLVLYKAGTMGRPVGQPAFEAWRTNVLKARFPKVARNHESLSAACAAAFGFVELAHETRAHRHRHQLNEYVENLLTHSRFIRVIDGGLEPLGEVRAWLRQELAPFFPTGSLEFEHEGKIHIFQREG